MVSYCSFKFLLDKNFARALQIIDSGGVRCFEAQKSKHRVFQVRDRHEDVYLHVPGPIVLSSDMFLLVAITAKATFALQVRGKSASDNYLVFPEHYCSCQAFFYEVVHRSEAPYVSPASARKLMHGPL